MLLSESSVLELANCYKFQAGILAQKDAYGVYIFLSAFYCTNWFISKKLTSLLLNGLFNTVNKF